MNALSNITFDKSIRFNAAKRKSFNDLAKSTFDISFKTWFQSGYWSDRYAPYTFCLEDRVIANVSVNTIDTLWNGTSRRYLQIGTVMTDPEFRHRGLSRQLMEKVLEDHGDNCDAIYLYANDEVLDFYPKFGFVMESEFAASLPLNNGLACAKKLDLTQPSNVQILLEYYKKSNPYSMMPMLDNFELLMFHCQGPCSNAVFLAEEEQALVIAEQTGDTLYCFDIYCEKGLSLDDCLKSVAYPDVKNVTFGFALRDTAKSSLFRVQEEDTTLFVLKSKENIFAESKTMLPTLSHA